MDQKNIIVTGAAGLIGSGIVRYLNDRGHTSNLILVDQFDHPAKVKNLRDKHYREMIPIQKLHSWLEGRGSEISAIFHLGACSDTLEQNESFLKENNTLYTQKLAEYSLKHGIRFIYASSAATYGDGTKGFSDSHELLEELQPLNLYGKSKHLFDLWALREGVLSQLVGLKYFNVFGPNESHKGRMASMVFKMVPVIQKEGVIRLFKSTEPERFADGGQCRDFIYIKDAVQMTCDFLDNTRGGIFNIGMGRPTTWNELATAVFKALNKPVLIEYIEMPRDLASQYQNYTCAEMNKYGLPLQLGFTIDTAVDDYVNNYLNPNVAW
ncbi:MAG: ADP-glyceromanno-heptose 6-epimerase [Rhabdochlamydiaceae bacterium]|nr:ADP-glyceromanno-heptose 6-epimerase [Rhabdochlamydiaceae bacterium]